MYKAIHRIEFVQNDQLVVLSPGDITNHIPNPEQLIAAGALQEYCPPEVTLTPMAEPQAKTGKKKPAADDSE